MTKEEIKFKDVTIPSRRLEGNLHIDFAPSVINGLADATYDTENNIGGSHASMPKLEDMNYSKVKFISIYIEGLGGYGGSCPKLNKRDFEELKRSCPAVMMSNREMIGTPVIAIYENNLFSSFLATTKYSEDIKRIRGRKE